MDKLVKPERLIADPNAPSASNEFNHWLHMFNNYIEALSSSKPSINKLQVLKNLVSWKLYRNISGLNNFETAISSLQRIFVKQTNILTSRRNLRTCKQHVDESIDNFVLRIKRLSKDCGCQAVNAETYRSELMCNALIDGIQSISIRKRLLENCSLTFQQAYDQARSLEASQNIVKTSTASSTDHLQQKDTLQSRGLKDQKASRLNAVNDQQHCRFCGKPRNHSRKNCPAKSAVCLYCRKVGHFSEVCDKRLQRFKNQENLKTTSSAQPVATVSKSASQNQTKDSCDVKSTESKENSKNEYQTSEGYIMRSVAEKHSLNVKHTLEKVVPVATPVTSHIQDTTNCKEASKSENLPESRSFLSSMQSNSQSFGHSLSNPHKIYLAVGESSDFVAEVMEALNLLDECIFHLTCNPGCYELVMPKLIKVLSAFNLISCVVSIIVDKIYEMCLLEQNFRFSGCRLLDELTRAETGSTRFRSYWLTKAQKEYECIDDILKNHPERARNFILFMAEMFSSIKLSTNAGFVRYHVLGRSTLALVRKLIDHPNDYNIQCAVCVLKLTFLSLKESLELDCKYSAKNLYMEQILDDLEAFYKNTAPKNQRTFSLLTDLVYLRRNYWLKVPVCESSQSQKSLLSQNPELLVLQDENYYMNEPMFFTQRGKMYTCADLVDPDFYKKYLAPHQQTIPPRETSYIPCIPEHAPIPNEELESSTNRRCYLNLLSVCNKTGYWKVSTTPEENIFRNYDERFEAFLNTLEELSSDCLG